MIDVNEIAQTLSDIKRGKNALSLLMEFEGVLDDLHIYAYENWIKGEVIRGPVTEKYWITVELMYPERFMPNPDGALRLINHDCHVYMGQDMLKSHVKVQKPEDLVPSDRIHKKVPDTEDIPVWVVKIIMPRHLLNDYNVKKFSALSGEIDLEDILDAYDQGLDVEDGGSTNEK